MAMKLPTPVTHAPMRGLPFTSGSLSIGDLRIFARLLGDSASPAKSGITLERSRMPPLASMIPGFSRPCGPKRTSFMGRSLHQGGGVPMWRGPDHASDVAWQARGLTIQRCWTISDRREATVLFKRSIGQATVAFRQLVAKIVQIGRLDSF